MSRRRPRRVAVPFRQVEPLIWEIPKEFKPSMRVPGRVFATKELITKMSQDRTLMQCSNVASLPGIQKYALTLPDGHEGYGFPIGGVAAFDSETGVISPGGVGYDINCGVRLLRTNLMWRDVESKLPQILEKLFQLIPSGLGSRGRLRLSKTEVTQIAREGVAWALAHDYGWKEDAEHCEANGCLAIADPSKISQRAIRRGQPQVGSLGSGNHFLEVQVVDEIFDSHAAKLVGLTEKDQVTVMIHTGSRGFGHQICSDYLRIMEHAARKYNIALPDRELACAPAMSPEAADYHAAMACAANYAWTNRQLITHWTRQAFAQVLKTSAENLDLAVVYDVAHNIAKREEHIIDGKRKTVYVHRKGATRAFPPDHAEIPSKYKKLGQPVIIPGSMGTASYLLAGTQKAMELTFGSTAHGAGRTLSRSAAKRQFWGKDVARNLKQRGILVRAASMRVLAEEADGAYKDIDVVARTSHDLGIATLVTRFVPRGVTKG
jgi:tRNA-splicing ligase RtcB